MKNIIKRLPLLFVIALSLIVACPSRVFAETGEISYININSSQSLEVGSLSFSNISFKNYSSTSTRAYGLTGTIINSSSKQVKYSSTAYYYDSSYNLIAQGYTSSIAISGSNSFSHMLNLNTLDGHTIDEIYYYRLLIETTDNENSSVINSTSLTPSLNYKYYYYDYVIDNYDINIIVNEDNTFDITETITAYFNIQKHGIFRTIPLINKVTRLDGTTSTNRTQVTNVSVDSEYTVSRENGNYKLKIGSASKTLIGKQEYIIKYTYNLGEDPIEDYDELYYNIIGDEWDTVIGNVTFSITMPKEFDTSKLGFSSGTTGSSDNSKVEYSVSGNKITGIYNDILGVGEALTVRCELPEGYFVGAGLNYSVMDYIGFIFPIIFLIIAFLLWYRFGRDDQVIETVEFYPPEGLNSLEVGFLFNGKAKNKDVTSLLIFLANKGYLEIANGDIDLKAEKVNLSENSKDSVNKKIIELQNKIDMERESGPNSPKIKYYENMLDMYKNIDTPIDYGEYGLKRSTNKKNKFLIRKSKDYDGADINEQWFMEGLFEYDKTEVTDTMLYDKFYKTNSKILSNINNKQNINRVFEKSSLNKKIIIILMIIITYCLITTPPMVNYGQSDTLFFALLLPGIGFSYLFTILFKAKHFIEKIFGFIWFFILGGMPFLDYVVPVLEQDVTYLIGYIIGIICVMGMVRCLIYLPKRTKYGNEMLGKLKGFKNFLETAEKDKLEAMVEENPNYFYDILPFTYVLDVSDKWIKKFEAISLQAPAWYDSPNSFNVSSFGTFVNSTMTSAQSAMSSSPSSSSGGSSGGGFSGGGSGGGGGGSW